MGGEGGWRARHTCDMATRLSAKGALTWWHLDDGGEIVFQVGLPLKEDRKLDGPVLLGPNGKPVVKLFIFAEKDAYDFIIQDIESNKTSRFNHLHLFDTHSSCLPDKVRTLARYGWGRCMHCLLVKVFDKLVSYAHLACLTGFFHG